MRRSLKNAAFVTSLVLALAGCATGKEEEDDEDDEESAEAKDEAKDEPAEAPVEESSPAEAAAPQSGSSFDEMLAQMKAQAAKSGQAVPEKKAAPAAAPAAKPATPAAAPATPAAPAAPDTMWVFTDKAPVYATPSKDGKKVKTLQYAEQVTAVEEKDEWVRIGDGQFVERKRLTDRKARFGGKVVGQAAKPAGKTAANAAVSGSGKPATGKRQPKVDGLAIRKSPALDAPVVGYLKAGDDVAIVAEGWNGWTQIGPDRYVRTKYLSTDGPTTLGSGPEVYTVKADSVYVRQSPDQSAMIVGVLKTGDTVKAAAPVNGWVQIAPKRFVREKHLQAVGH